MDKACAIYLRTSGYGESLENQEAALSQFLESNSIKTVAKFVEKETGPTRPAFEDLITKIENEEVSAVLIYSLDRLDNIAPSLSEFFKFIDLLSRNEIRFISLVDEIDTSETASTFITKSIDRLNAAREVIRGERIHWALTSAKASGQSVGRTREAEYNEILQLRAQGLSTYEIAERLNISRGTVQHCLRTNQ